MGVNISALPASTGSATGDLLPTVSVAGPVTQKMTLAQLITFLQQNVAMVYSGAGNPNGLVSAFKGSFYTGDDGTGWRRTTPGFNSTWDQLF